MIPAEYYSIVFVFLVLLLSISSVGRLSVSIYPLDDSYESFDETAYCVAIAIILFVGFRPNSFVFNDGPGYWMAMIDHRWEKAIEGHFWTRTGTEADNYFIFARMMAFLSSLNVSPRLCFIILSAIIYGFAFVAFKKILPDNLLLSFLLFCGTFGTFGFATNGIKNGCAMSFFICALAYRNDWKLCALFLWLSLGFHHSMALSIGSFIICSFYKNTKVFFAIWLFSLLAAVFHITFFQSIFALFTDDHASEYLLPGADSWVSGFRLDFILYSIAPIALGWWVIIKKQVVSETYEFMLNVYLLMNSIWLLCMYASFTNRIAQLSWSLFPLLIIYPLTELEISEDQNLVLKWFVIGQFSFTTLMAFLYIGRA